MGYSLVYDISLSSHHYYDCVLKTRDFIKTSPAFTAEEKSKVLTAAYGHVGDGNLHMNIQVPGY